MSVQRFHGVGPLKIICDGCQTEIDCQLMADDSDNAKGLYVSEQHYAECRRCKYKFTIHLKMEEDEATGTAT